MRPGLRVVDEVLVGNARPSREGILLPRWLLLNREMDRARATGAGPTMPLSPAAPARTKRPRQSLFLWRRDEPRVISKAEIIAMFPGSPLANLYQDSATVAATSEGSASNHQSGGCCAH